MKNSVRIILTAALLLSSWSVFAARRSVRDSVSFLCAGKIFASGQIGVYAENGQGRTIASVNPEKKLVPASNLKLITTGAALIELGPSYRFCTTLSHDGHIMPDSTLCGNLYITGGGDPTTGAEGEKQCGSDSLFTIWKGLLLQSGIARIQGDIIGDAGYFEDFSPCPSWSLEDLKSADGTAPCGLNFHKNRNREGATFGTGPADCAEAFLKFLNSSGFRVEGVPGSILPGDGNSIPDSSRFAGCSFSEPMEKLIRLTNHRSDNFLAETLFKAVGKHHMCSDRREDCIESEKQILASLGLSLTDACNITDGCGLSRKNCASPAFIVRYLKAICKRSEGEMLVASLPSPGQEHTTLHTRMEKHPLPLKARVKMKSGSLEGTACMSGVIEARSGKKEERIYFSIMTNNLPGSKKSVLTAIDRIIATLASYN